MRLEILYLQDIVDAADEIRRFRKGIDRETFMNNHLVQSAILQKLIVIGEAASRLPEEFRKKHSEIEWTDIVAFRNIAVHEYFAVEWRIVWTTAIQDVPRLRKYITVILKSELSKNVK